MNDVYRYYGQPAYAPTSHAVVPSRGSLNPYSLTHGVHAQWALPPSAIPMQAPQMMSGMPAWGMSRPPVAVYAGLRAGTAAPREYSTGSSMAYPAPSEPATGQPSPTYSTISPRGPSPGAAVAPAAVPAAPSPAKRSRSAYELPPDSQEAQSQPPETTRKTKRAVASPSPKLEEAEALIGLASRIQHREHARRSRVRAKAALENLESEVSHLEREVQHYLNIVSAHGVDVSKLPSLNHKPTLQRPPPIDEELGETIDPSLDEATRQLMRRRRKNRVNSRRNRSRNTAKKHNLVLMRDVLQWRSTELQKTLRELGIITGPSHNPTPQQVNRNGKRPRGW